jgi:phage terminase large subunit-like protein
MAMGKVYFPTNAPWMAELETELFTFPAGVHDDQVDALAILGRMLDKMVSKTVNENTLKPMDRWRRAFERSGSGDQKWKTA